MPVIDMPVIDMPTIGLGKSDWPASNGRSEVSRPPGAQAFPAMAVSAPGEGSITQSPHDFEGPLDPIDNSRFRAQMFKRAMLYGLLYAFGVVAFLIVFLIIGLILGGLSGIPKVLILYFVGGALTAIVLVLLFLLLKIPIQISEWAVSVDGKGAAAATAFEYVGRSLQRRQIPLQSLRVQRLQLPGGEGRRDYLELRRNIFYGYVSCFPFGNDLYVGWTFWIQLSPLKWYGMILVRIWETVTHKTSDLYMALRYESAKAMRDALHAATREGVDAAVQNLGVQRPAIIGSVIRVDTTP